MLGPGAYARIRAHHSERRRDHAVGKRASLYVGAIRIAHTSHLVDSFRSIQSELADVRGSDGDDDISNSCTALAL